MKKREGKGKTESGEGQDTQHTRIFERAHFLSFPVCSVEETRERLEQAQLRTAEAVSDTTTVTQATTPMDENVRLWSQNLQDFQHSSEAYDSAVHSAGDAGMVT